MDDYLDEKLGLSLELYDNYVRCLLMLSISIVNLPATESDGFVLSFCWSAIRDKVTFTNYITTDVQKDDEPKNLSILYSPINGKTWETKTSLCKDSKLFKRETQAVKKRIGNVSVHRIGCYGCTLVTW